MNAFRKVTPHIVTSELSDEAIEDALVVISMIEHRMDSYLRPLAERSDANGSTFYASVVADCGRDLAALKRGVEEFGRAQDDRALKGMGHG